LEIRAIKNENIPQLVNLFVSVFNQPPWSEDWKTEWAIDRLSIICHFYGLLAENNNKMIGAIFQESVVLRVN